MLKSKHLRRGAPKSDTVSISGSGPPERKGGATSAWAEFWCSSWAHGAAMLVAGLLAIIVSVLVWHMTSAARWSAPLCVSGDCTQELTIIKTVVDHGWFTNNPDLGAPFGAELYDFPIPEPTTAALFHLIGLFATSVWLIYNVYYILGFALAAVAACWALRKLGVSLLLSVAGGVAFAILPYHFLRIMHLQLSCYFPVAIYCCYALRLSIHECEPSIEPAKITWKTLLLIAVAAGGGVYYAFFGCIFVATGAAVGSIRRSDITPIRVGASYIGTIVLVVVVSLTPNYWYHFVHGNNQLVANRAVSDAQLYGLQIIEMLLPTTGHRFGWANAFTQTYYHQALLINENSTAGLGVMGGVGFLAALGALVVGAWRRLPALAASGALIGVGVLYATVGGFGALVAYLLIPDIRGLNRISVFIAFFSLFALLWLISTFFRRHRNHIMGAAVSLAVVLIASADQIPTHAIPNSAAAAARVADFQSVSAEFSRLQNVLSPGTAVFELPYMFYPEAPPHDGIWSYDLFIPYLYTRGFRWSFGGMHGRPSGRWSDYVSRLSGIRFVDALSSFGFGAVYVDGAGYKDRGVAINGELAFLFGPPVWHFGNRNVYRVHSISGAKNFAIVSYGNGWFPEEPPTAHQQATTWAWSRGDAALDLFNPRQSADPVIVRFRLGTVAPRHVMIDYCGHNLGEARLARTSDVLVTLRVQAAPGVSYVKLSSNVPAQRPGNGDPRKLAFRVMNLEVVRPGPRPSVSDTANNTARDK